MNLAKQNQRKINKLMKAPELKCYQVTKTSSDTSSTGAFPTQSFHIIAQGVAEGERIGREVTIKRISIHGEIKANTANTEDQFVRYILYLDKACQGAVPVATDLLDTAEYESFRNLDNIKRFTFLEDRTVRLNKNGTTGTTILRMNINKTLKIPIIYSSTLGVITENTENCIGMFLISSAGTLSEVGYRARVRYTDV